MPNGTAVMTAPGSVHDSYWAARTRYPMTRPNANAADEVPPDCFSSKARPDQAKAYPGGSTSRATSSIARIACPELCPGAAWPLILAAGRPLKWGRRSGPRTHVVFTRAESGTIWPLLERV